MGRMTRLSLLCCICLQVVSATIRPVFAAANNNNKAGIISSKADDWPLDPVEVLLEATADTAATDDGADFFVPVSKGENNSAGFNMYSIIGSPTSPFPPIVSITVSKHECGGDQVYDPSLHECRKQCRRGEVYWSLSNLGACLTEAMYNRTKDRPSCKDVNLVAGEYAIDRDGFLSLPRANLTFAPNQYVNTSGAGVKVCYPFTDEFMLCTRWYLEPNEFEYRNGGLKIWVHPYQRLYDTGEFLVKNMSVDEVGVLVCTGPDEPEIRRERERMTYVYAACWTVSAVSMFLSIIIYLILRPLKYHTMTLLCHMLSLLIFYLLLITRVWAGDLEGPFCEAMGIGLNFAFLAAFFWLNVLAFDIWKRLPQYNIQSISASTRCPKFVCASLYGWGLPFVIAGSAAAVNYLTPSSNPFNPNYHDDCWLKTLLPKIVFMYSFAAILLISNFIFFILTVVNLRKLGRDAAMVNRRIHNQLFQMYMKLMIVMGLCWTMEVLSAMLESGNNSRMWYFSDIINCLQGFFIFVIYVCKRSVVNDLIRKWEKHLGPCCCRRVLLKVFSTDKSHRVATRDRSSSTTVFPNHSDYGMNSTSSIRVSSNSITSS